MATRFDGWPPLEGAASIRRSRNSWPPRRILRTPARSSRGCANGSIVRAWRSTSPLCPTRPLPTSASLSERAPLRVMGHRWPSSSARAGAERVVGQLGASEALRRRGASGRGTVVGSARSLAEVLAAVWGSVARYLLDGDQAPTRDRAFIADFSGGRYAVLP